MAVKTYELVSALSQKLIVRWAGGSNNDSGTPLEIPGGSALAGAVQMTGTVGITTLQLSNDGQNWATAKDLQGEDIVLSAAGLVEFTTAALYLRPIYGAGAAACVVTLVLRG